jgi:hypothetical protein
MLGFTGLAASEASSGTPAAEQFGGDVAGILLLALAISIGSVAPKFASGNSLKVGWMCVCVCVCGGGGGQWAQQQQQDGVRCSRTSSSRAAAPAVAAAAVLGVLCKVQQVMWYGVQQADVASWCDPGAS